MGHHDEQHDQSGTQTGNQPQGNQPQTGGDATKSAQGGYNDRSQREMERGDATDPAMPDGTTPLERSERPINQSR